MAYETVARAVRGAPVLGPLVPRNVYLADRWTGWLEIELDFDAKSPLVLGSGTLEYRKRTIPGEVKTVRIGRKTVRHPEPDRVEEFLVAEIVRRGEKKIPVIPGSSLKGALRQSYELLTPSCEPGKGKKGGSCFVPAKDQVARVCPACSLFGAMGLGGRLSPGEAEPLSEGSSVRIVRRSVPTPWNPRKEIVGSYRFYDTRKAVDREGKSRPESEETWAAVGKFRGRIRLVNASDEELGLVFASLGLGVDAPGPSLRVGGKKFHGFGGARIRLARACQVQRQRRSLEGEDAQAWVSERLEAALDAEPIRRATWERLHEVLGSRG